MIMGLFKKKKKIDSPICTLPMVKVFTLWKLFLPELELTQGNIYFGRLSCNKKTEGKKKKKLN